MALTYRQTKGSALTNEELDGNFQHFTGSHSITGSLTVTGGITGSFLGTGSNAVSASYAITASYLDAATLFISQSNPLPTVDDGNLAVSASNLYFRSGSNWHQVSLI